LAYGSGPDPTLISIGAFAKEDVIGRLEIPQGITCHLAGFAGYCRVSRAASYPK
jgi:hypothetical protein